MSEQDENEIDLAKQQFAEQQGFEDWADYQTWMLHTNTTKDKRDLAWYGVIKHYADSKLKERDELLELMYDELIRAKHHVLKGYCYTAIQMKELDNLITRYSNLKAK